MREGRREGEREGGRCGLFARICVERDPGRETWFELCDFVCG